MPRNEIMQTIQTLKTCCLINVQKMNVKSIRQTATNMNITELQFPDLEQAHAEC